LHDEDFESEIFPKETYCEPFLQKKMNKDCRELLLI